MSRVLLLLSLAALAMAKSHNATKIATADFCAEYVGCMERAQTKANECSSSDTAVELGGKKANCQAAKDVHRELQQLFEERDTELVSCVNDKRSDLEAVLTGKKAEKCTAALKKISKRSSLEPSKREKRKERRDKKEKNAMKSCAKEARKLRFQCTKIAKCCSVVKQCHTGSAKDEISAKKTELKQVAKQCRESDKKNKKAKKQSRKGKLTAVDGETKKPRANINQKLEKAQAKKRQAPIGGKKLEAEVTSSSAATH